MLHRHVPRETLVELMIVVVVLLSHGHHDAPAKPGRLGEDKLV
jgi:hypothetical protein